MGTNNDNNISIHIISIDFKIHIWDSHFILRIKQQI
jgi:hypothetical protein